MKSSRCWLTGEIEAQHVIDIGGNKLRLIALMHYRAQKLFIQQVLDHGEYDKGKWRE